ncbi:hypothetical protein ACROYT_G013535 [Oculina patagonica]
MWSLYKYSSATESVIWHHLYDTSSCKDKGTLYAARNMIDARNVTNDPHDNFMACGEFLDKVTDLPDLGGITPLRDGDIGEEIRIQRRISTLGILTISKQSKTMSRKY